MFVGYKADWAEAVSCLNWRMYLETGWVGKCRQCVEGVECQEELLSVDVLGPKKMLKILLKGQDMTPFKEHSPGKISY